MMELFKLCKEYPFIPILVTISLLFTPSFPYDIDEMQTNVDLEPCDSADTQANITTIFMDPPCDKVSDGYCGVRRKQNYTLLVKFYPKLTSKALYGRATTVHPRYGFETPLWPDWNVCNRYNMTCPQHTTEPVRLHLYDDLPSDVPPLKGIFRVRLLGIGEDNIRRTIICRQIKAQII